MITLNEVAEKLEKILNGNDSETSGLTTPTDFYFRVEAQGFHIDHIMNKDVGTNFIPVFVSSMGGQINPVKGLNQASYVVPVTFYFPVRFKEEIFKLGDFLMNAFVGANLNYGTTANPKNAISNISVPVYGEIIGMDLQEFEKWVENVYQRSVGRKNEPFMSMSFNLYLSTAGDQFIFGNAAKINLKRTTSASDAGEDIVFDRSSIQTNAQTSSEQEMDTNESESLPLGTSYGFGFTAYPKNNEWWRNLITDWFNGGMQTITLYLTLTIKLDDTHTLTFSRECYVDSVNMPVEPGQLISVTFSLGKKVS